MKLQKYIMPLMCMAMFSSCSNGLIDGDQPSESQNNLDAAYFTLNISQGMTRSEGESGKETGDNNRRENTLHNILLIFADTNNKFLAKSETTLTSDNSSKDYVATFSVEGSYLTALANYSEQEVNIFVVCNPVGTELTFNPGNDVQNVLEISSENINKYNWNGTDGYFLMSNADQTNRSKIDVAGIKSGKYGKGKEMHNLGKINVQRATARFDVAPIQPASNEINGISVNFNGLSLINLNKKFYLFKQVGSNPNYEYFAPENGVNWVKDPVAEKTNITESNKTNLNFGEWFINYASEKPVGQLNYTLFTSLTSDDNLEKGSESWPADATDDQKGRDYKFWRYATPNNVEGIENQKAGNSTGIVFRAELQQGTTSGIANWGTKDMFAFGNKIYGDFETLKAIAQKSTFTNSDEEALAMAYKSIGNSPTEEQVAENANFKRFKVENGKYYCYYYYWNRHRDNGDSQTMGNMEYQVVRNNIYKLAVTKVSGLGVPGDDIPDPSRPNEEATTEANFMVEVVVVPWDVIINDIEF